jgi:hypothetical protein
MNHWPAIAALLPLSLLAACTTGKSAAQSACTADAVQTSPGLYIFAASGQIYQVYPTDNQTSMLWRPLDKLTICPLTGGAVTITNTSEKNAKVRALQVTYLF